MSNAELREIIPLNPKKALLIYKKLYPTLSDAPDPEQVLNRWRDVYGKYRNIQAFIKEIIYFIFNNWTSLTDAKIKQI
jgi:hypothetical protein|tara:strand:- start:313 stop:546 length:234 start_codon:yes stop_codon:yes gene_type:complete